MIQYRLPWPPSALRPNRARTRHWASNATAAACYKSLCAVELRAQGIQPVNVDRIALYLTFCPPDRRRYDRDGSLSAAKAALDQLASMLGIDDSEFEPITLCRGPVVKGGEVRVTLTEE